MSRTVDKRVVEMQFDNGQFERNVQTSMSTIDKLKQSLNFNGATKGLESVNQASRNVDFSQMAAGVEALQNRFSTLGIVGMRVIQNLTDSAMRFTSKIANFLTSGVIQGGIQRAMNLENAHFQLQGLLKDEEAVSAVMQNVNDSVDGTAYSLDAAAKVASQLAASGMRAGDDMYTSLRAVAGVAAMTNSEYESIGEIFTTVAGNGRLMGEQLLQLSSRGLNAAATLGEYLGKSESEVRDMVSKGQIDFQTFADAMDDAFGEHAKKANETFTGSMSNIKAALARIGALFVSPLVVQNGPLVQLFNTFREAVNDLKSAIGPLADQFTGSVSKMAEAAKNFLTRMTSEDRIKMFSNIVSTLTNTFSGLWSILKPIGEAFKDIFPAIATDRLIDFTEKIKNLTEKIKLSSTESENLKDTFKGAFSVIKLVVDVVTTVAKGIGNLLSKLTGVRGGLLGITGAIGRWLTKVISAVKETGAFQSVVGGLSDYLGGCLEGLKKFASILKEKLVAPGFETLVELLKKLWSLVETIGSKISGFFSRIGESFNGGSLNGFLTAMGSLILMKTAYSKWFDDWAPVIKRWKSIFQDGFVGTVKSITSGVDGFVSALNSIKSNLWTFNKSIKYDNLKKLATALLMLAAAMLVISLIDTDKLVSSFAAVESLVFTLMAVINQFDKINSAKGLKGLSASSALTDMGLAMVSLSVSVLILASAMKKLGGMNLDELAKGFGAIVGLMGTLAAAAKIMDDDKKAIMKFGGQMVIMSTAVLILSTACKKLGSLSFGDLTKGVGGVLSLTMIFVAAAKILSKDEKAIAKFSGQMLIMSAGIAIMAQTCKSLGSLSWEALSKGALGLLGVTGLLVAAAKILAKDGKKMLEGAGQMVLLSVSIAIMGRTLSKLSSLSWEGLAKGLIAIGGAMAILVIGLEDMEGTVKGSAALLIAAAALAVLAPVITSLGKMSWEGIAKGLIAIAGAFAIIGVAGLVLEPIIPAIIALGAAVGLIGLGCIAAGAGLQFFASGLAMLATVTAAAATTIVATLKVILLGVLGMVPELANALILAVKSLIGVFVECVPELANGVLKLIVGVFEALVQYTPQIVDLAFKFLLAIFDGIGQNAPRLVKSIVDMFANIFSAVVDALSNVNPDILLKGTACIGALILIAHGMASLVAITPAALVGVGAFGLIVAELGAVLAALGALSKSPEVQALITGGGNILEKIGTAIGQFIGGIAGGIAKGVTSTLPSIGTSLSQFMTNLQPFLDGARSIDATTFDGVMSLVKVIAAISGSSMLEYISQWVTGYSSIAVFANQLVPFGEAISEFSSVVSGNVDEGAITAAANAGKIIAEMADTIPNTGGVAAFFAGDNDLATFAEGLIPFGEAISEFSSTVAGNVDANAITSAANAGQIIAEMANTLPNTGGVVASFTGDNNLAVFAKQLIPFGAAMSTFSVLVKDVDAAAVTGAANAGKALAEMANTIPNTGGLLTLFTGDNRLDIFGLQLIAFGTAMAAFSGIVSGNIDEASVMAAANAGKVMAEMQATLPNTGGVFSLFTGQNDLILFGGQLIAFGEAIAGFSQAVSGKIDESAITAAANAGKTMAEMQATLPNTGGVVQFFSGNKEDLETFATGITAFGEAMCGFSQAIAADGTFSADAVTAAANAGKALAEMQATLPNTDGVIQFFSGNKEGLATFAEGLAPFGEAMAEFSAAVSGNVDPDAVTAAANAGKMLSEMQANLPKDGGIFSIFSGSSEDMASFGADIKTFGEAMCGFSQAITADGAFNSDAVTAAANAGKTIANMASAIPDDISNLGVLSAKLEPFGEALGNLYSRISEINLDLLSTAAEQIKDIVDKLSSVSSSGLDKFVDNFSKAETEAISASAKMCDSTISKIESKSSKFKSAGKKLTDNLIKGIKQTKADIPKAFTGGLDDAVSDIKDSYTDFYDAGSYLVDGFASGISANIWKAEAKAEAMAEAAAAAAKEALDINSPSKVFRSIGYSIPEGLAQGIERMGSTVKVASVAMADRAFDSTKASLNRLSQLFEGDVNTQPVIRPVVDLSGVSEGVGKMNNMLSIDPSVSAFSNIRGISAMMNNRQNGANDDVISAIKDLGRRIGESSGDTYSINGITYDDGSNVSDAIRTLVREAKIERRK